MKQQRLIPLILVMLFSMSACEKLLVKEPTNVRVGASAVKTSADVQQLLNSAYDILRSNELMGGNDWLVAELLADNLNASQVTGNYLAVYNRNTTIFNAAGRNLWDNFYTCINRSNLVLEAVEKVTGIKPEDRANMRGQALFIRAFCHFELVRLFAQPWGYSSKNDHDGVPLRLSSSLKPIGRATVFDVYTQVLSDLNNAIQELPADITPGIANVWAAKGLLARVYFQQNNFFFALKYSKDVVENGASIFQGNLKLRFNAANSTDNVFELSTDGSGSGDAKSGSLLLSNYYSVGKRPVISYSTDFYGELKRDAGEQRVNDWCVLVPASGSDPELYEPSKLNYSLSFRIPVIHLAEIKLIYAESALEQSDVSSSKIQLNDIRNRAGLSKITTSNVADLKDEIRHQRRLEMVLEGNRIHDLKRQAVRDANNPFIRNAPWNCPGMVLAIPDDEMSANPLIRQNELGGCN